MAKGPAALGGAGRIKILARGIKFGLPRGVSWHPLSKGAWAGLPAKPIMDGERRQKIGADGKPRCAPVAEWRNRELAAGFSDAVVAAVSQAHPDDLS